MKLSTREDIDAPLADVFVAVRDFDAFERGLLRRGIDVMRDPEGEVCIGTRWHATPEWHGRRYEVEAELMTLTTDEGWSVECHGAGLVALAVVDLVALAPGRTRLFASVDMRPTTMRSRILLQSVKLAKGGLTRRFKERVRGFARSLG